MWDIRRQTSLSDFIRDTYPQKRLDKTEARINKLAMTAIKKLDTKSFGNTMSDMVNWVNQVSQPEDRILRATSLFKFLERFMEELEVRHLIKHGFYKRANVSQGHVTHYADDFLELAVGLLHAADSTSPEGVAVLSYILGTLKVALMHDENSKSTAF